MAGLRALRIFAALYVAASAVIIARENAKLREINGYLVDRLERVEPVPITILDGLGRDISHLNGERVA